MRLLRNGVLLCLAGDAAAAEVLTTSPLVIIIGLIPVILVAFYAMGVWIYREAKAWRQKKNTRKKAKRK